jgi:acyl-coenzyme A synthetase/AMP-(fatty) acid ligase
LHPEANVAQCWGTTEAGWHTLFDWNEKDTSGSVGRLLPNVDIKLLDDNESSIPSEDEVGEALIRSPGMFRRYIGDQQASSEAFHSDGFYRTGDFAFVRDGKVFYTGRRKEIMKVNGWQVSPIEVETVLLEDPRIVDAAVYGVSCDNGQGIWQTTLCAFVVRSLLESVNAKDQSSDEPHEEAVHKLTEEDVKKFVASRLISYKHLKRVSFVKRIPRSPTGKILRSRLNEVELDE